jgi:hypothetical protein
MALREQQYPQSIECARIRRHSPHPRMHTPPAHAHPTHTPTQLAPAYRTFLWVCCLLLLAAPAACSCRLSMPPAHSSQPSPARQQAAPSRPTPRHAPPDRGSHLAAPLRPSTPLSAAPRPP